MSRVLTYWPVFLITIATQSAIAKNNEGLSCKLEEVSHYLQVKVVLEQGIHDTWNSVTYDIRIDERVAMYYLNLVMKEYCKYPEGYLQKANINTIVITRNLKFNDQPRAAIPDPLRKQLYLSVNGAFVVASERYLTHVMHHELHHCTEHAIWSSMTFDWHDWMILNGDGFCYGDGGESAYRTFMKDGVDYYSPSNPHHGFINRYSMTGDEEDRAEIMAFIMTDRELESFIGLYKKDQTIRNKTKLLFKLIHDFSDSQMYFPKILEPVPL